MYEERSNASRSIVWRIRTDPLVVFSKYCDFKKRKARATLSAGVPARHAALVTWKLYVWLKGIERAPHKTEARKSPAMLIPGEIVLLASVPAIHCNVRANGSEQTRMPALAKQFRNNNAVKPGPTGMIGRTETLLWPATAWLCVSCALRVVGPYVISVSVNAIAATVGIGFPKRPR